MPVSWLLLAEALLCLGRAPARLAACLHLTCAVALASQLPTAGALLFLTLGLLPARRPTSDRLAALFPCLLTGALYAEVPGGHVIVQLWGLWAVWVTVCILSRGDDLLESAHLPPLLLVLIAVFPFVIVMHWLDELIGWERGRRQPRRVGGQWPTRPRYLRPRVVLPSLCAFAAALLCPLLAFVLALFPFGCDHRGERLKIPRAGRLGMTLAWLVGGLPAWPAAWGSLTLAKLTLLIFSAQVAREFGGQTSLARDDEHRCLGAEMVGWALVTCLASACGGPVAIPGTALFCSLLTSLALTPAWPTRGWL